MQSCGQARISSGQLLKGSNACADATVELRHRHLQGQIQGGQTNWTGAPSLLRLGAAEQLEDRNTERVPQRGTEPCFSELHGGEGGGADHSRHLLALEQIQGSSLDPWVPKAADPESPRGEPLCSEGVEQGLGQGQITGLQERPVEDDTDTRSDIVTPVVGFRVLNGVDLGELQLAVIEPVAKGAQDLQKIGCTPFPEAAAAGCGEFSGNAAEAGKGLVLIGGPGQNHQRSFGVCRGPLPELLEAITPVPASAKQSDQHQLRAAKAGADVVIENRWVLQAGQVETLDLASRSCRTTVLIQAGRQGSQVGVGAGEEHQLRPGLLHVGHPVIRAVATRDSRKTVHCSILLVQHSRLGTQQ